MWFDEFGEMCHHPKERKEIDTYYSPEIVYQTKMSVKNVNNDCEDYEDYESFYKKEKKTGFLNEFIKRLKGEI
jgi:hypothetical protein